MRYVQLEPALSLRPYVRCYWELQGRSEAVAAPEAILPDGCTELVFHFGEPFRYRRALQPRVIFVGQMAHPTTVEPSRDVGCFGVRFEPAGAWSLFGFRQADVSGEILAAATLLKPSVERDILSAQTTGDRVRLIESALLAVAPPQPDPWCEAVSAILGGTQSVTQLRSASGISARQMQRMFLTRVGISPRLFARLARFRQALRCTGPWADIAVSCGYYDQSHLIRDFRQFAGAPPCGIPSDLMSQSSNTRRRAAV